MTRQDFGWALQQLREGKNVCRAGWNGKEQSLRLVLPPVRENEPPGYWEKWRASAEFPADEMLDLPCIWIRTVSRHRVPWLASQTDMLAEDWEVY